VIAFQYVDAFIRILAHPQGPAPHVIPLLRASVQEQPTESQAESRHCFWLYGPQQRLAFRPLPQGQGSLRPTEAAGIGASGRPHVKVMSA
jgi:hypothetical protein